MTTAIIINPPDDETKSPIENSSSTILKSFPRTIIQSIENNRQYNLSHAHSTSDFLNVNQSSIDTTDDDIDEITTTTTTTTSSLQENRKHSLIVTYTKQLPSETQVSLYPDTSQHLINSQIDVSNSTYINEIHGSDPSLIDKKSSKQKRVEYIRRTLLEHRLGRRIHSSFSSSLTLRSLSRRRSTQNLFQRSNRRHTYYLSKNSKWHIVRNHLHDIAMMSNPYARMQVIEQDLRWIHLREQIRKQVLDMREMSILRQQDIGLLKKSQKTSFDLKTIPINQVVHVERNGKVYSIGTRDLVLGRFIDNEDIKLDTFAQLDARRKFQVKQNLLRRQEGRTRLKQHIAFSFCLCNLSFIVLMFATMFIFVMKTIIELKSREFL